MIVLALVVAVVAVLYGLGWVSCGRYRREGLMLLAVAALVSAPALLAQQTRPAAPLSGSGISDLVAGLKATPGCLGVETARTSSGKAVIFAWFENKRALMTWYTSDAHVHAMQSVFPGHQPSGTALKDIPDGTGPILTIASFTPANPATAPSGAPPFTQIAIEHYTPLAGGIAVGGRFAPAAVKVPGLRELTLPSAGPEK